MVLFDNDSTATLTERERALLEMLAKCLRCLTQLTYSRFISGNDPASSDMRNRVAGLQRAAFNLIDSDGATRGAVYGGK
jgi:hypothetical protein